MNKVRCSKKVPVSLIAALLGFPLFLGAQEGDFVAVTDAMLASPDPADWLLWRRTLDGWGYSPLDQIKQDNVEDLELVWRHQIGPGFQEGVPLVYDGRMFVPSANDYIQAFAADTGKLLWEYRKDYPPGVSGGTNRNIAIWGGTIINAGSDNTIYALDALSGEQVRQTQVLEPGLPAQATSGPIVANGRIITGRQCQAAAGTDACIITAHDAATGEELWRSRTIPRPGEPGNDSWGDVALEDRLNVGTWMVPSYDLEQDLVLIGTSVTMPAPKFLLGGNDKQHLYHNSTLALDGATGELVWHYQHLVDHWDMDHVFERLLVDTAVSPDPGEVAWINPGLEPGERRQVITGVPGKTGIVYTLDRVTGEFLWARETITQNIVSRIDGESGEVRLNPDVVFTEKGQNLYTCPATIGGKNWQAGAYSPRSNAMYMPMFHLCMDARSTVARGEWDLPLQYGFDFQSNIRPPEGTDKVGNVWAISAQTGAELWRQEQRAGVMSLVATGGGLVFGGDVGGSFKAYDDETGEVLWETQLHAPVSGYPITFAVDGRQYVAVTTGPSLLALAVGGITPEVLENDEAGGNVFVFALPE